MTISKSWITNPRGSMDSTRSKRIKKEGDGGGAAGSFGDGGGTAFTSTDTGIFSPTYGGGSGPKRKKKKLGLHLNQFKKQENINADLKLPVDDIQILQADDDEYDRGLLVKYTNDKSYEVAYWYDDVEVYPVEVVVDGESVKKDARKVEFKFHPELSKEDVATAVASVSSNIFPSNKLNRDDQPKKRKRTGVHRLADFLTENSPERKMQKDNKMIKSFVEWVSKEKTPKGFYQQTSGETINSQPPRIEWAKDTKDMNEENNPVEFKGHPDKGAADRQKNEERRIKSLDDAEDKQDSEPSYTGSANAARPAGLNIKLAWESGPESDELSRGGDKDEDQGEVVDDEKESTDRFETSRQILEELKKLYS